MKWIDAHRDILLPRVSVLCECLAGDGRIFYCIGFYRFINDAIIEWLSCSILSIFEDNDDGDMLEINVIKWSHIEKSDGLEINS